MPQRISLSEKKQVQQMCGSGHLTALLRARGFGMEQRMHIPNPQVVGVIQVAQQHFIVGPMENPTTGLGMVLLGLKEKIVR